MTSIFCLLLGVHFLVVHGITRNRFNSNEKLVKLGLKLFSNDEQFDTFLASISDPPRSYEVETFRGSVKMVLANTIKGDALDVWGNEFGHQKNIAPRYQNKVFAPYRLDRMVYNETGKVHTGNYYMHDGGLHSTLQRRYQGVLIDVGSNVGGFSVFSALSYPLLKVYAIEPSPTSFWLLNYNLYLNHLLDDPRMHTFHMAVGVPAEKWDTHVTLMDNTEDSQMSFVSLNDTNKHTESNNSKVAYQVLARPFTVWQSEQNITKINFMKVDCEGCEFYLLPELQRAVLRKRRIEHLSLELHTRLLNPSIKTDADKPPQENIARTEWLLNRRPGCGDMRMWIHHC